MNGNKLYRSTSEAILGGVASGLGNYFKVDPTIIRIAFVVLAFFTGGGFILAYLAMWLLIPTAGSTASSAGDVVRENLDEMGARVRSGFGGNGGTAPTNGGAPANGNGAPNGAPNGTPNGGTSVQFSAGTHPRYGMLPVILIGIGGFFLLAKLGLFHAGFWGAWWPLVLIGVGLCLLARRRA
jgi:phage shock protein PspC (stress-responsive transcriptional regulator)